MALSQVDIEEGSIGNNVTAGNVEGNANLNDYLYADDNSMHVGDVAQDLTVSGSPVATTKSLAIQLLQLWLREASQRRGGPPPITTHSR